MRGIGEPGPSDAWLTLAGLARETNSIRLGTLLSAATFRRPGILAVMAAQLDIMSNGRFECGLGAGWFGPEHLTHGIPFPPVVERFDRLEEQLGILDAFWATPAGQRFSHVGEHFQILDMPALPRPI
jgi:alkanesulfonate monooxygenase SsuD/methylene tetrahydromethanopterin reductase-like flavin-dependent oxidoreductase (luciferase family)